MSEQTPEPAPQGEPDEDVGPDREGARERMTMDYPVVFTRRPDVESEDQGDDG